MLKELNILYAPDYVINAGGLINVYQELKGYDEDQARKKTAQIYDTLITIFKTADKDGITTIQASNRIGEERVAKGKGMTNLRNTMDNQLWIASNKN